MRDITSVHIIYLAYKENKKKNNLRKLLHRVLILLIIFGVRPTYELDEVLPFIRYGSALKFSEKSYRWTSCTVHVEKLTLAVQLVVYIIVWLLTCGSTTQMDVVAAPEIYTVSFSVHLSFIYLTLMLNSIRNVIQISYILVA